MDARTTHDRRLQDVLTAELPLERFEAGYNPFSTIMMSPSSYFPFYKRPPEEYRRVLRYRGVIRYNGEALPLSTDWKWSIPQKGPFYRIADDGRRLVFRLPDHTTTPASGSITVSARRHCFAPRRFWPGLYFPARTAPAWRQWRYSVAACGTFINPRRPPLVDRRCRGGGGNRRRHQPRSNRST